ncbi:MAG: hypothetical protein N3B01_11395 [Verrucomicrobiae bacterium]|nr:hypothetical protein [Verrucomicrobiae bacterium]
MKPGGHGFGFGPYRDFRQGTRAIAWIDNGWHGRVADVPDCGLCFDALRAG